jgi:hypothetical protein
MVQKLPKLIRGPDSERWLEAIRLAGVLKGQALLILRNIGSPAARRVLEDHLPHETNRENKEIIEDTLNVNQKGN